MSVVWQWDKMNIMCVGLDINESNYSTLPQEVNSLLLLLTDELSGHKEMFVDFVVWFVSCVLNRVLL